jgi:hypothetical protein
MLDFNNVVESSSQQGFAYERNAAEVLKTYDIVPQFFTPAGAGSNQPDLIIKRPGLLADGTAGCELKITAASAGSLVLKYNNGKWQFNDISATDYEKLFIRDLANKVGIFNIINNKWREEPYKGTTNPNLKKEMESLTKRQIYQRDLGLFKDIKGEINATEIEEYYNRKDTYYVNVGTHGFYLLGPNNPLNFKNIPRFGNSALAIYRARVQYKGSDNYQFTFEMQFRIPSGKKSPFNIAPIISKNNVNIDTNSLDLDWVKSK